MAVLQYPITNEKAIGLIELKNTLMFVVTSQATKPEIKKEVEALFGVKVASVNTLITPTGVKRAFVKLKEGFKADDVAAKLKIV
jgi:large subunit ribosomal protein L23